MRPSDGRFSLWPAAVLLFVIVFAAPSLKSVVHLNSSPPADYLALHASTLPKTQVARAYWDVAVRVIQWKYNRTTVLPEQTPADFTLSADGEKFSAEDRASRVAYWKKLREEWLRPENWRTTYSFDLSWIVSGFQSAWQEGQKLF